MLASELAEALSKHGHIVKVITSLPKQSAPRYEQKNTLYIRRCPTIPMPYKYAFFSLELFKALDIDVNVAHFMSCLPTFFNWYGVLHYYIRKKPLVFTTVWPSLLRIHLYKGIKKVLGIFYDLKLVKYLLKPVDVVVSLTESEMLFFKHLLQDKMICVIPEGVHLPTSIPSNEEILGLKTRYGIGDDEYILICVGRVHPTKRLEYALYAMRHICNKLPSTKLIPVSYTHLTLPTTERV